VFQVAISHRAGSIDTEKRLSRDRFLPYLAQQPPATVLLEACGSSHHWARQLEQLGHMVRLLPAHVCDATKTDRTDAKALLEAARNEDIHPVPSRRSSTRRSRRYTVSARRGWLRAPPGSTPCGGLLREFGIFIPVGAQHVVPRVRELLSEPTAVPDLMRATLASTCDEIGVLETNMREVERQLTTLAQQLPDVTLLRQCRAWAC